MDMITDSEAELARIRIMVLVEHEKMLKANKELEAAKLDFAQAYTFASGMRKDLESRLLSLEKAFKEETVRKALQISQTFFVDSENNSEMHAWENWSVEGGFLGLNDSRKNSMDSIDSMDATDSTGAVDAVHEGEGVDAKAVETELEKSF